MSELASMAGAYALLHQLTKLYPPIARHSHSFTFHKGLLQVNLLHTVPCESVVFSVEDLAKPIPQLVKEIAALVPKDPNKTST